MKIAVCVKEVPDATAPKRIDPGTKRLDRSGEKTMNPYDAHALEEAVRLKEGAAGADSQITALCMGPEGALRTLHKALSLGADEALLVSDPALEGADIAATARVLAAAAKHLGADLVLLGQQASDSDSYVMAAAVAEHLQLPLVTQVARLELTGDGDPREAPDRDGLRRRRGAAAGRRSPSPTRSTSRATRRSRRSWARARSRRPRSRWPISASRAARGTEVLELTPPPAKEGGRRIEDENGSSAEEIVAFLLERKAI